MCYDDLDWRPGLKMRVYFKCQNNKLYEVTAMGTDCESTTTSELATNENYDFDHIYLFKETALKLRHLNFKRFGHLVTEVQDDYGVGRVKFVKTSATTVQEALDALYSGPRAASLVAPGPGVQLVKSTPPKVHKYNLNNPEDCLGAFAQYGVMSVDNCKRDYLGAQPSKEKSEVTRPLTKEEAKLKRQETKAGATLRQVSFVVNRVTEVISQGTSEFGLVEDLLPESVTAVKEVFPFVKLTQVDTSKTYEPGIGRKVIVEFVD